MAEAHCRRRRAAKSSASGVAGRQRCRGGWASVVRVSVGEPGPCAGCGGGGSATRRLGARACKTCALGAPRARTERVRQNARAAQSARGRLAINRTRLGVARILVDKVAGSEDQVHSAN